MSHLSQRLRRRLTRQTSLLQPSVQREFLKAFDTLRTLLDDVALERLLRESGFGAAEVLTEEMLDEAFGKLRVAVQQTLREGTISASRFVAGVNPGAVFDVLNPHVITAARTLDTRVMTTLKAATRETFRETVLEGLQEGVGPRTIARRARSTIGMAPNQAKAVSNFRRMLEAGDATALSRKLRDKRFDRTLLKAFGPDGKGLTPDQVARMTKAYERRMLAFNAEVNARTATVDALRSGQRLSWEEAVANGTVDRSRLMKRRVVVDDGRQRPEHEALRNQVRHFDEPYSNGEMISGDSSFNCRCLDAYFLRAQTASLAA